MKFIREDGHRLVGAKKVKVKFGIFVCDRCNGEVSSNIYYGKKAKSCSKCINKTHGMTNTRLFRTWTSMKTRVNLKPTTYKDLNLDICDEWKDNFIAFKEWSEANGYRDNLTIDRIDNEIGYHPYNCRWTDVSTQQNNKREIQVNNKSGFKGVSKQGKKWRAGKTINKKSVCFGLFDTIEEAIASYKENTK